MSAVEQIQNRPSRLSGEDNRSYITPPANIAATGNDYVIELEMPGVSKEGLEVSVEGDEITVIGRRKQELPEGELWYSESALADYKRVFELGADVDTEKISAEMTQGILKLRLPKSEKAKPRRIEVKLA